MVSSCQNGRLGPEIPKFPVKFPVSREFTRRQVRSALRRQPIVPEAGGSPPPSPDRSSPWRKRSPAAAVGDAEAQRPNLSTRRLSLRAMHIEKIGVERETAVAKKMILRPPQMKQLLVSNPQRVTSFLMRRMASRATSKRCLNHDLDENRWCRELGFYRGPCRRVGTVDPGFPNLVHSGGVSDGRQPYIGAD
jgi:hypothetical protein